MGDAGEVWRAHREHRRDKRRHFHECPTCAVAYGTGTKVEPGTECRNCGWEAPSVSATTGEPWEVRHA